MEKIIIEYYSDWDSGEIQITKDELSSDKFISEDNIVYFIKTALKNMCDIDLEKALKEGADD
jgi:hypothetical protein